jgi:tight adherence protein B
MILGFFGGVLAAAALRMSVGWILGGAFGASLPFLFLKIKRKRRLNAFEEAFPEALDLIARALKAGHAFATGLKMVADEMPEPVGPEFRKTFDEQNFGLPLKDALGNLTARIPLLDVRFFSTAVLIQRETGGNLSEILENLAHVVRERFKILRQVRVYTAHGRLTGYVLLGLPVFLAIALAFINPEHMQLLFRERIGHMMLGATAVMQTIGYFWIKQVVKIEV